MKIEKTYCINLIRRNDRLQNAQKQFQKSKIDVEIFSALDMNDIKINYQLKSGSLACSFSHYQLIQRAKICGHKSILIFEDDVILHDDFSNQLEILMANCPHDCDLLYLGGSNAERPTKFNDHVSRCHKTFTTHAYVINESIYDVVLDQVEQFNDVIDVIYTSLQPINNFYISNKTLAWQMAGFSDLEKRFMDYPWIKNNLI